MVPRLEGTVDGKFNTNDLNNEQLKGVETSEKRIVEEQNGSIHLELGSYRAIKFPLYMIVIMFIFYPYIWTMTPDPRMDDLPLMDSIWPIITLSISYMFLSLVWGPRFMRNRAPIKLKKVQMVYNLIQIIVCSYIFIQMGRLGWFWDYSYTCQPVDLSFEGKSFQFTRMVYLYFLTKILDLFDTVFFLLNKKWTHITLLHVIHHGALVVGIFVLAKYIPGGNSTFVGFLNSFVHVLMYTYYLLTGMGPAVKPFLWWKKYITIIQMIQFVMVFLHSIQVFFIECQTLRIYQFFICIYAFIFCFLFLDFYQNSYQKKSQKTKEVMTRKNR